MELVKVYAGQLQGNTTREADQAYVFDDRGLLMMKYTKKGLEVSRNPSSLTGRAKPVVADRLGILDEAYIPTESLETP